MSEIYVIAEAAQGYEGSVEVAKLLVRSAACSGANAIKFQVVYADDLCEKNYEHYALFSSLELSVEQWEEVRALAKALELDFIVDVFGEKSLFVAKKIVVDAIKLHSTTFFDRDLFEKVYDLPCRLFLSVGGIESGEIVMLFHEYGLAQHEELCLMYGFQAEPTPIEDNNLRRINTFKTLLGAQSIGFMDHSDGEGPDHINLSVMALGMGIKVFEKHITLDRALKMEDYPSALSASGCLEYTTTLRRLALAFGSDSLQLSGKELTYRNNVLKRVVAASDLKAGSVIDEDSVRLSRSAERKGAYLMQAVVGRRLQVPVSEGEGVTEEMLAS